jgi:hypothetical protein
MPVSDRIYLVDLNSIPYQKITQKSILLTLIWIVSSRESSILYDNYLIIFCCPSSLIKRNNLFNYEPFYQMSFSPFT